MILTQCHAAHNKLFHRGLLAPASYWRNDVSMLVDQTRYLCRKRRVAISGYELTRMGSLEELSAYTKRERAMHPEGENELYAKWQQSQYMHSMFSAHNGTLDNARYTVNWTSLAELAKRQQR